MVNSNNSNLGTSVVPDLMRVYESLTQSKKQQGPHEVGASASVNGGASTSREHPNSHALQHSVPSTNPPQDLTYPPSASLHPSVPHPPANPILPQNPPGFQPSASPPQDVSAAKKASRPRRSSSRKRPAETEKGDSGDAKGRKKKAGDGRWSKRFAWPDELHRDFVSAVFDVGLKHSSPSSILEQMAPHEQITTERIKSHLQKYRLHRQKSKKEFMSSYDSTLVKMKAGEEDLADPLSFNCGEVAAHLTVSTITEKEVVGVDPGSLVQGGILQLPQLTEQEKRSPVGASLGYLMGLFFSLKQQLHAQRGIQESAVDGPVIIPSTSPQPAILPPHQPSSIVSQPTALHSHATVSVDRGDSNFQSYNGHSQSQHIPSSVSTTSDQSYNTSASQQQQHPSQQNYFSSHPAASTSLPSSATEAKPGPISSSSASMPPPDTRNNSLMEESNMMKRDMQSQMEFQNKMRKLKEQELSKYTQSTSDNNSYEPEPGAAAAAAAVTASITANLGLDTDWLKTDQVLDDQLFEFLMND